MIVTFQSQASGDVMMFGEVAHQMMEIIGKEVAEKGIVTVEQLPDAIVRLHAAMAANKSEHALNADQPESEREDRKVAVPGSLTQRIVPLLELFERSLKNDKPVVWGL